MTCRWENSLEKNVNNITIQMMNKELLQTLKDVVLGNDPTDLAELFNIYSKNCSEEYNSDEERYVFNILNNRQAAKAVAMFGFETVENAAKDDWIIFANKDIDTGKWEFSNKSPESALDSVFELFVYDVICTPFSYPKWVSEAIGPHIATHLSFEREPKEISKKTINQ